MRIVHASNFSLRENGANYYGHPYKITNGLMRLGHFVFNYCDRDIASANPLRVRSLGRGRANRKLVGVCHELAPDLLLLGHCTLIAEDTIREIRAAHPGIRIAHWNCDGLFLENNLKRLRALAPIVDMSFVTTAGVDLRQVVDGRGGRVCFIPNPVDSSIETLKVFAQNDVPNDLVFFTGYNKHDKEKLDKCAAIRARMPDLKFDVRGLFEQPGVYGAALFDVLSRAKMGLNVSKRNDVYLYSSDRMAYMLGCGLLTFTDKRARFEDILTPDELVTYGDDEELVDKIDHFRRHDDERKRVAANGWKRAHEIFGEKIVAQWILDATFDRPHSLTYSWPTEIFCG